MKGKIKLVGFEEVKNKYISFWKSANVTRSAYLEMIGNEAISLLRQNTPVDTGALRDSWQIVEKTENSVTIGVSDDQEEKLQFVLGGSGSSPGRFVPALGARIITDKKGSDFKGIHPGTPMNNFVEQVQQSVNDLMASSMGKAMDVSGHEYYKGFGIRGLINPMRVTNLGKSVPRRGASTINRLRSGIPKLRVRIGRRRHTSSRDYTKTIKLG